jgi:hypothetical protein
MALLSLNSNTHTEDRASGKPGKLTKPVLTMNVRTDHSAEIGRWESELGNTRKTQLINQFQDIKQRQLPTWDRLKP